MFLLDQTRYKLSYMRRASQTARTASLDRELDKFKYDLLRFLSDKESFVDELHWRIKQLISRWHSLNRNRLGTHGNTQLMSPKQIEQLLHWEYNLKLKTYGQSLLDIYDDEKIPDVLLRFIQARYDSKTLYDQFTREIYEPLNEFFKDDVVTHNARALDAVLQRWQNLLSPGIINHNLFSWSSTEALCYIGSKHKIRSLKFNSLLRLIPDLALKAFEALLLAQKWRENISVTSGYTRELRFIKSKGTSEKRVTEICSGSKKMKQEEHNSGYSNTESLCTKTILKTLPQTDEKEESKSHYVIVKDVPTSRCFFRCLEQKLYKRYEAQIYLQSDKEQNSKHLEMKQHIDVLQKELRREHLGIQRIRTKLLFIEICSKLTKSALLTKPLEEQLKERKKSCKVLQTEICSCFLH